MELEQDSDQREFGLCLKVEQERETDDREEERSMQKAYPKQI